jgi:hypothetical protein
MSDNTQSHSADSTATDCGYIQTYAYNRDSFDILSYVNYSFDYIINEVSYAPYSRQHYDEHYGTHIHLFRIDSLYHILTTYFVGHMTYYVCHFPAQVRNKPRSLSQV